MNIAKFEDSLSALFTNTAKAHHEAFKSTNGNDVEWPIWYANYIQDPISEILDTPFLKSNLIYCLMNVDFEYTTMEEDTPWQNFYSKHFIQHFAPSDAPTNDSLALYYSPGCPYCKMVIKIISQLNVNMELRNIDENLEYRKELVSIRGRSTVPVLHIATPHGDERWMPESRDIINYLQKMYNNKD